MKKYKISYSEMIFGEMFHTSYIAYFQSEREMNEAISGIYEYSQAEYVAYEEIK